MNSIGAYLLQRFPPAVFGPAVISIAGVALWAVERPSTLRFLHALTLGLILITQFRLWDDLEDRERDRLVHPERVLTMTATGRFRVLLSVLVVAAAAACAGRAAALAALAVTEFTFWWAYRWLRPRLADDTWCFGVLLLKYPALLCVTTLAIDAPVPRRLGIAAIAAYLCAAGYELWHNRPLHLGVS